MSEGFRPLLSPQDDPLKNPDFFKRIQAALPLMVAPKYDGIRGVVRGPVMSRTFKALPSTQVQASFSSYRVPELLGYDGELIEGCETDPDVYNRTQSHVMSENKPGDLRYFVFDNTHDSVIHLPFYQRLETLRSDSSKIILVQHDFVETIDDLLKYEEEKLSLGFEGIMMRHPVGRYKNGRATFKEGIIFKLKRFEDGEGIVVGLEEAMHNTNLQERDELGFAKRSDTKDAKSGAGRVGKFLIEFADDQFGTQVLAVAPGTYKHDQLTEIWNNPELVLHKLMKFRFMRTGAKDKPRHPRALGLRDVMDL